MKHANRYDSINIIEDDGPIYRVRFSNFMYICGRKAVDVYRKYDFDCSFEQAYHNLCSAVRELDELALANDGRTNALTSPELAHIGDEILFMGEWRSYNDDDGLPVRHLFFDSEVNDFERETVDTYTNWASAWITQVA